MVYQWRSGARIKISAQIAGDRLEKLRNKLGRAVDATDVIEDAADESSPLYKAFEWNDSAAAEQYRLQQARHLLNCLIVTRVKVKHPNEDRPRIVTKVRAYHSVVQQDSDGYTSRGYETTARILSSAELREQLLNEVAISLDSIRRKYKQLKELAGVFAAIADFKKKVRLANKSGKLKTIAKKPVKTAKVSAPSTKAAFINPK